jgi:hypothetical protein
MDDLNHILLSIDPGIHAIVQGASRGDRTVVPALRAYLEQALARFIDSKAVTARTAAASDGKSKAELYAVVKRTTAPTTFYDQLVEAASHLPDASLEPVLQERAERMEGDEVLGALEKVRSLTTPAGANANVTAVGIRSLGRRSLTVSWPSSCVTASSGESRLRLDAHRSMVC